MAGWSTSLGGALLLLSALSARTAAAGSAAPETRLLYVRDVSAEGCPDRERLEQAVVTRLGHEALLRTERASPRSRSRSDGRRTARIAEVAGVSPGSMYQYFPSKDALITALFQSEAEEGQRAFVAIAAELGTGDAPRLIRALVAWSVDRLESKLALNRVLLEEVPRVSGLEQSREVDRLAANAVQLLLEAGKDRVHAGDLEVAAMLVVRAFRYNIIPLLRDPLTGKKREAFIDELSELIGAYLLAPRPWRVRE